MGKNNIDQRGMIGLLSILESSAQDSKIPSFMSTHPLSSERKQFAIVEAAKQSMKTPHPYLENKFNNIQKLLNE
jgi:predicted Zn-dependent protease